jgi:hypothetical protein
MERPVTVINPIDGRPIEGFEVPVLESTERWTDVKLEDGSLLRIKPSVLSAIRIPGQFDQEGNPMYMLRANNAMMVVEAKDDLKKAAFDAGSVRKAN